MLTRLCLVRHAETEWNRLDRVQGHTDIALNDTGIARTREAATRLRGDDWDGIVSSPLLRATQTAHLLGHGAGIRGCRTERRLIERSYGAAEGLTSEERAALYPDGNVPGLESREATAERALAAFAGLHADRPGARLLVVTHGSLIKCVLMRLRPNLPDTTLNVALLSGTLLEGNDDGWTVRFVGRPIASRHRRQRVVRRAGSKRREESRLDGGRSS